MIKIWNIEGVNYLQVDDKYIHFSHVALSKEGIRFYSGETLVYILDYSIQIDAQIQRKVNQNNVILTTKYLIETVK